MEKIGGSLWVRDMQNQELVMEKPETFVPLLPKKTSQPLVKNLLDQIISPFILFNLCMFPSPVVIKTLSPDRDIPPINEKFSESSSVNLVFHNTLPVSVDLA